MSDEADIPSRTDLNLPNYLWCGPESVSAAGSSSNQRTGIQQYQIDALKII
jgi:hypothetical protein